MAVAYDKSNKLFQVDYQSPFGGIDSTAYATAIDPHNFVDTDGIYIEDNVIKTVLMGKIGNNLTGIVGNYLGFIPVPDNLGNSPSLGFVVTDQAIYGVQYIGGVLSLTAHVTYTPAKVGDNSYFHYIVIDNVQSGVPDVYWTAGGWNEIWVRNGTSSAVTLNTNYVGGGILGLLDNQLINLGGYSQADGSVPNRISWSAPGQYGQFMPYDVGTGLGNYAAGFNDLPSVSDVITGFAAIGTVGYIFRTQGITQVNPTGNGIQPFLFDHLWASELGIGTPYPYTVSSYGSVCCFVSDSGVYTLGINGLKEIGQSARTYIYARLNNLWEAQFPVLLNGPQGRITPYLVTTPELVYTLAIPSLTNAANPSTPTYDFITIDVISGNVYNLGQQVPLASLTGTISLAFFNTNIFGTGSIPGSRLIVPLFVSGESASAVTTISLWWLLTEATKVGTIIHRKEQLQFGNVPTVSKVGFLCCLIDTDQDGLIQVSVDGGSTFSTIFNDITILFGQGDAGNGIPDILYSNGVQSLQRPQLVYKLTNVKVVEAWYQGTLADYPVI